MNNHLIKHSFLRGLLAPVLIGVGVFGWTQNIQAQQPSVLSVQSYPDTETYAAGEDIQIMVLFDTAIKVTYDPNDLPYLNLDLLPSSGKAYLMMANPGTQYIIFRYEVRPGDFTADLAYQNQWSLILSSGATVENFSTGERWEPYLNPLPAPGTGNALDGTSDVQIRTIDIAGPSTINQGAMANLTVSRGGTQSSSMEVEMSYPPQISGPAFVTIPAGGASVTFPVSGVAPSGAPVEVSARAYPGVPAGDESIFIQVTDIPPPEVDQVYDPYGLVPGSATYTIGQEIQIIVQFTNNVVVTPASDGREPYLNLFLYPQSARAEMIEVAGSEIRFGYTVKPGDFSGGLSYPNATALNLNGAKITDQDTGVPWSMTQGVPAPGTPGALDVTSDSRIRTLSLTGQGFVDEGSSVQWTVGRGGVYPEQMTVNLFYSPEGHLESPPASVVIPADNDAVSFSLVGALEHPGVVVRARPQGYPSDGSGDVSNTLEVIRMPRELIVEANAVDFFEGQNRELRVRRTGPIQDAIDVNLVSSAPTRANVSQATLRIPAGRDISDPITISGLDGTYSATITVTSPGYDDGTWNVEILNLNPTFSSGPTVTPTDPTVGQTVRVSFSVNEVSADRPPAGGNLTARIDWGDGSAEDVIVNATDTIFRVPHVYGQDGTYRVTVRVRDKDYASAGPEIGEAEWESPEITVQPGITLTVTVLADYLNLSGIGSGTYQLLTAPVAVVEPGVFLYPESQATVRIRALPDQPGYPATNSYLFVWEGDGLPERDTNPLGFGTGDPPSFEYPQVETIVTMNGQDQIVNIVFSREWRVGDGRGDIDGDGLSDFWERTWFRAGGNNPGLSPIIPSGGAVVDPADRLPNAPSVIHDPTDLYPDGTPAAGPFGYPIPWSAGWTGYAPLGPGFNNLFHFRGQTLSLWDADSPHLLNGGLDPNIADSNGDGMNDGWLYYFWVNAVNDTNFIGRAYDPNTITGSLVIANADIQYYFNPSLNRGLAGEDLDGDGLTTLEEYYLGTNPIDYDTDGDRLPDGWEILYGLDPLDSRDAGENPDEDYMADDGAGRIHNDVYLQHGFDPRTGWAEEILQPNLSWEDPAPNSREFTSLDEFLALRWHLDRGAVDAIPAEDWSDWSTDPLSPDSDADGMPDGWELYVGLNPKEGKDGSEDPDDESLPSSLSNTEEFSCQGAQILYPPEKILALQAYVADRMASHLPTWDYILASVSGEDIVEAHRRGALGLTPEHFVMRDPGWLNKFWPTDPFNPDTDGDQITDGRSATHSRYDIEGITGTSARTCFVGGGLNPNSVDTDGDALPDYWEAWFAGSGTGGGPVQNENGEWVRDGMDGTWPDAHDDYDGDGLLNYQEYLVGAMYHFNYDKWQAGQGYNGYDPFDFFDPAVYGASPNTWDNAYWWDEDLGIRFYFQLAEFRFGFHFEISGFPADPLFATTDPREWDTDGDGMDDYYEMFHGLNPLWSMLGDVVGKIRPPVVRDARVQPWQVGDEEADPDQDGIPNWEEAIHPNRVDPMPHHTDPTPYWFTDMSYSESFVNLYYQTKSLPFYWSEDPILFPPTYLFSFASNEGYDTDNDNLPDKREIIGSDQPGVTDPLDFNAPMRRNALYLDGNAAARTRGGFFHGSEILRSWTVEAWIRPEAPTGSRQIILERPVNFYPGDTLPPTEYVRRNFRLGISQDGALFVEYNNDGSDLLTKIAHTVYSPPDLFEPQTWVHVAGVYSGTEKQLRLYVNGELQGTAQADDIPANGSKYGNPDIFRRAPIVVGAADSNPSGRVAGSPRYAGGGTFSPMSQPALHSFYKGWIDEIRIWDGARSSAQVNETMHSKMRSEDVQALQPALMYHYNFSSLPDPNYEDIVPAYFNSLDGRPQDGSYPGIPWWMQAADASTVYDNYLYVPWIQNMVAHLPIDPPLDSVYWGEFSTGGEADTNDFRNTANPYTHGYGHALSALDESNPEFSEPIVSGGFDPAINRLYNDLLPLRNAMADQSVELWDGAGPGMSLEYDSSGDGMPDWWKLQYGLDPYTSEGEHGSWGDPDRDGLPNWAEFLAWKQFNDQFGTILDPWDYDSFDDGFSDYDSRPDASWPQTFGQMYDDWDGMAGLWEVIYGLDPHSYDGHLDPDGDGWSNYAEFMGSTLPNDVNSFPKPALILDAVYEGQNDTGTLVIEAYSSPDMDGSPDARFSQEVQAAMNITDEFMDTIRYGVREYSGKLSVAPIVPGSILLTIGRTPSSVFAETFTGVQDEFGAWTSQLQAPYGSTGTINYNTGEWSIRLIAPFANSSYIDGESLRADYSANRTGDLYPFRFSRDLPESGHLREGPNWFFVYIDADGSGGWTPGDPCAISFGQPYRLSWSALDLGNIVLRDYITGYPRFAWTVDPAALEYDVTIRLGTQIVFEKTVRAPRNYFHEGDLINAGIFGLSHGDNLSPTYEWTVGTETGNVSTEWKNSLSDTRGDPSDLMPDTGKVRTSPFELRWKADRRNAAFEVQIVPDSMGGTPVFDRILPAVPVRHGDTEQKFEYRFYPQTASESFVELPDGVYYWRVRAQNPATTYDSAWSAYAEFTVDKDNVGGTGPYSIDGLLQYFGPLTNQPVTVQAFKSPFSGRPVAQKKVSDPKSAYSLRGLPAGNYYVRAFMDQTGSGVPEVWETRGILFDSAAKALWAEHGVRRVQVGPDKTGTKIVLRDRDTDNDKYADAWEYAEYGNLTTLGVTDQPALLWESEPLWLAEDEPTMMSIESTNEEDSNGDGMPDRLKYTLGLSTLAVDSDVDGVSDLTEFFSGSLSEKQPMVFMIPAMIMDSEGRPGICWDIPQASLHAAASASLALVYTIEWTASLSQPDWQTVGTVIVSRLDDYGRKVWTHTDNTFGSGFYRVKAYVAQPSMAR